MYNYVAEFKKKVKLTKLGKNIFDPTTLGTGKNGVKWVAATPRGATKIETPLTRKVSLLNKSGITPSEYHPLNKRLPFNYGGSSRTRRIREMFPYNYNQDY